jgi:hypothetical protein
MVLKRAGIPTDRMRCVLRVPGLDLQDKRHFYSSHPIDKLRRFLREWIPDGEAREGATFTVSAQVRHRDNQGLRWVVLCRWRAGEPVYKAIEEAEAGWKELQARKL